MHATCRKRRIVFFNRSYWPDAEDPAFAEELTRLHDDRFRRGEMMVEKLQELGFAISFERVKEIAGGGNIIRPHVAQAMVQAGIVDTEREAFDLYIADGKPAHVGKHALDPVDAVRVILDAGGICVLAHPGMWGDQTSVPEELIERMAAVGMQGLEVDHRSDIYSLGCTLYHALTGHVPFEAPSVEELVAAHVHTALAPPNLVVPEITQPTSDALVKVLAKNPADRYLSYDEFRMALEAARSNLLVQQYAQGPGTKGVKTKTSWWRR